MKPSHPKIMKKLFGAMIIFVVSGATLLAQDQITGPTTLDNTPEVPVAPFGGEIMTPPLPLPTDDFSQPDFQSQMVEANRSTFQNNAGAIMPPSSLSSSFSIQPAPEPSPFALGSLAIGLIALVRLSRRQQILNR